MHRCGLLLTGEAGFTEHLRWQKRAANLMSSETGGDLGNRWQDQWSACLPLRNGTGVDRNQQRNAEPRTGTGRASRSLPLEPSHRSEIRGKNPFDARNGGNNELKPVGWGRGWLEGPSSVKGWENSGVRHRSCLISISAVSCKRRQEVEGWLPFILQPSSSTAPMSLLPAEPKDFERARKHQFQ